MIVPIYVVHRGLHLQEYARGVFHDDDGTSTAWVNEGPEKATRGGVNESQLKFLTGTWPIS
jgi:hypothetical protein